MVKIMKHIALLLLLVIATNANADNALLGKWKDKSKPDVYRYEFAKNNDFIYTNTTNYSGKLNVNVSKGVWETGAWLITNNKTGAKHSCRLTVYAETIECCFEYKFIANNLILTNEHSTERYGSMCESRVLISADKK